MRKYKEPLVCVNGIMEGQKNRDGQVITTISLSLSALNYQLKQQTLKNLGVKE